MISDVALWFAKNSKGEIKTINEVHYHDDKYYCPLCNSEVIPKALKENSKVTEHFAHLDRSKCTPESMIHWWYKNKFIQRGDKFIVTTDEMHTYVCKDILIEQTYHTEHGDYKPDVTITTESGESIYFEYAFTNKKKVKDYLDKWLELGNIVVEINLKTLLQANYGKDTYNFHALFYNGKCFNTNKHDLYYKTIGKYKEQVYTNKSVDSKEKKEIEKLDYIWNLVSKYKAMKLSKNELLSALYDCDCIFNNVVIDILIKSRCTEIIDDLFNEFKNQILAEIKLYNNIDYPSMYEHLRIDYRCKTRYSEPMIEIQHYNILEKCWYVSKLSNYKTRQELIDYVIKGFKENEKALELERLKSENETKFHNIEILVNNSECIKHLKELFNDDTMYNLELYFNSSQDEYGLQISLNYNHNLHCCVSNSRIDIDINNCNIECLCHQIQKNIQNSLLNLNPFSKSQIIMLDNIYKKLNDYYKYTKLNIAFNGELIRPNEYELQFEYKFKREGRSKHNNPYLYSSNENHSYYITKNTISDLHGLKEEYSNVLEIKPKIISIISQFIRELKSREKIIDRR